MADTSVGTITTSAEIRTRSNVGPFWVNQNVGAIIMPPGAEGPPPPSAWRTDDAGATWSEDANPDSGETGVFGCWFDRQGVGDAGNLVHVAWLDDVAGEFLYCPYNVATGAWGTVRTIASGLSLSTSAVNHRLFITKARSGRLYAGYVRNATGSGAWESTDAGATWNSIANPWESNAQDHAIGVYCNTGDDNDCAIAFWDNSASEISIKVYDESGDSWGETSVGTSMAYVEQAVNMAVATRHSDGATILAAWNAINSAAADLKVWQIDIDLTPSVTALADVLTNSDDSWGVGLFIDGDSEDIYCAYLRGTADYTVDAGVVYYKLSDDDGATWETEATYQEGTEDDHRMVSGGAMGAAESGGRWQPMFINADTTVAYVNLVNDVEFEMGALVTHTMSAGVVFDATPTWESVLPSVTGSYTLEVDWDNDGDFSEAIEDITEYVMDCQTFTGRDYASHLTGNAAPGTLIAYLNNADGRFSSFKTSGPLYESDGWLGRKVRLRSASSTPTDPVILARDRFNRANGSLGTAEIGGSWTNLVAGLAIVDQVVYSSGATDISTVDAGAADHYAQIRIAEPGSGTGAGVDVYFRVTDGSNYGVFGLRSNGQGGGSVVVSGSTVSEFSVEIPWVVGTILAVYAVGNVATCYVNGVPVGTLDIADDTATDVGFAVTKSGGDDSAGADDFLVLSGLPTPTDGVLWTGTLEYVEPESVPGPFKTATLRAVGPLRKLNETDVTPPVYLDGVQTGHAVGAILNRAGITLPGRIDPGQLTTGPYVRDADSALALCRELEDVEIGFLHETHEGQVAFDSRAVRALNQTVEAVFSDATADPFALRYQSIRQLDWRDLIFNKVKASLSPYSEGSETTLYTDPGPYALASGETRELTATYSGLVSRWTGHSRDVRIGGAPTVISVASETFAEGTTTAAVDMPATVAADDLLLVVSTHPMSAAGWTELPGYVYAKNAVGDEDGTSVNFTVASSPNPIVVHVFRIDDWPGSLSNISDLWVYDSGYWVNPQVFGGGTYYNEIRANFPWGATPTLVIASVRGLGITPNPNVTAAPSGYSGLTYAELQASGGAYSYLATAYKTVTATTEKPGSFTVTGDTPRFGQVYALRGNPSSETPVTGSLPNGADGKFTIGYDAGVGGTTQVHENIEVTGYPIVEGDLVTVLSEDTTSQDKFGVREYPEVAPLFPNTGEAQLWADTVVAAAKDPHPLLELSFIANKSAAYMTQAMNRRVGDRITVRAENNADLGIDEDFFIESIEHHLSQGNTRHDVTWTLSPASVTDP